MAEALTASRAQKLLARLLTALATAPLRAPRSDEGETAYTRAVLAPLVLELLKDISFQGLVPCGDGAASVKSAHVLGVAFYPDISVEHYREPVIAVEVKFLRGANRQNPIATAVGQALVYRQRYPLVAVFLVDVAGRLRDEDLADGRSFMANALGLPLVVRRRDRGGVLAADSG